MRVAVEPERRVHRGDGGPGDRRRGDVLPDRVARGAVDEREALALHALGQGGEPGAGVVGDRRPGPLHRAPGVDVEALDLEPADGGRVVVAADAQAPRCPGAARRPRPAPARSPRCRPAARPRPPTGRPPAPRRGRRGWRGYRRGPRHALGQGSGARPWSEGRAGVARRAPAGSGRRSARRVGTMTRRWSSSPGTRTRWISGLPARSARRRRPRRRAPLHRVALPGDEHAARRDERQGELHELRERRHGAGRHARAMPRGRAGRGRWPPSAAPPRRPRRSRPVARITVSRKRTFLPTESTSSVRSDARRRGQRDPGKAAAATRGRAAARSRAPGGPAPRRGCRATWRRATSAGLPDRRQVDRRRPRQQQADVPVEDRARGRRAGPARGHGVPPPAHRAYAAGSGGRS